jgi:hypothetical protein
MTPDPAETAATPAIQTAGQSAIKLAPPSPRSGYRLPLGRHPGNTGGKKGRSGPKPSAVRQLMREGLADRVPLLLALIDDPKTSAADRIRGLELLARHGIGTTTTITDDDGQAVAPPALVVVQTAG